MNIDYSLPSASRRSLLLDVPFRYGYRHLCHVGMNMVLKKFFNFSIMGRKETIKHIVLGILEMVPVVGHCIALLDAWTNGCRIRVIYLENTDPFEMGKEQGIKLKKEIQLLLGKGLKIYKMIMEKEGKNPLEEAKKLEPFIPENYRKEIKGIADGAELSYEEVLVANTIMDTMQLFGCSIYAVSYDNSTQQQRREIATNYYVSMGQNPGVLDIDQSFWRYNQLKNMQTLPTVSNLKKAMLKVNYYDTIQSIIFDNDARDIHLAKAGGFGADTSYTHIKGKKLFGREKQSASHRTTKIARNLDWPMPILGPATVVIVRPSHHNKKATAIVGWPGILGALSGINEEGAALAISIVPSEKQAGMPNQFLFRAILEEATTIKETLDIVNSAKPASPMNLIVATIDGIARIELDPARCSTGPAHVAYGEASTLSRKVFASSTA